MGKVRDYLLQEIDKFGCIHITLLDPDKVSIDEFVKLAKYAESCGSSALMVGGSLGVSSTLLDEYLKEVKKHISIPVILFPGSIAGLSNYADAVWFLSVLNSTNTYYIIEAQVQAAVLLAKVYRNVEVIPLAYIIVGEGGTVSYVSQARPIPYEKPELILAYTLAAQYLGFEFIYLEAGSGARKPIPPEIVKLVKKYVTKPLIIGGGIRNPEIAEKIAESGANIIVTGTIVEENPEKLRNIVEAVHRGGTKRKLKT